MLSRAATAVVLVVSTFVVARGGAAASAAADPAVLVYADGNGQVLTAALDGSGKRVVLTGARAPVVSPDGSMIAFVDSATNRLGVSAVDGTGRRVFGVAARPTSWAADNATVAVEAASSLSPNPGLVDVATGSLHLLSQTRTERNPQISPDGTFVASTTSGGQVIRRPSGAWPQVRAAAGGWLSPDGRLTVRQTSYTHGEAPYEVRTTVGQTVQWSGAVTSPPPADYYVTHLRSAAFSPDSATLFLAVNQYFEAKDISDIPSGIFTATAAAPTPTLLIPHATYVSVGGGTRPADTDGPPPAASGLQVVSGPGTARLAWTNPAVGDGAGAEIRYALGPVAPAAVTEGSDWGRVLDPTATRTALPPDTTYSVSVFSRDWFGNVGPPAKLTFTTAHEQSTSLTLHAVPFDLAWQQRTVLSGTLTRTRDGAPIADASLTVDRVVVGTTNYLPVGTVRTDSAGRYSFTQIPAASFFYRVRFQGSADYVASTASTRVRVARGATISVSATRALAGTRVIITTRTTPALSNGKTYLQVKLRFGLPFQRVGPHNTDPSGVVVYSALVPPRGITWQYRVEVLAAGPYLPTTTAAVLVTGT